MWPPIQMGIAPFAGRGTAAKGGKVKNSPLNSTRSPAQQARMIRIASSLHAPRRA